MGKKYIVTLSSEEEEMLVELISSGTQRVRKIAHAHILLKANAGWTDKQISQAVNVSVPTIVRVRQRLVEEGIDLALQPRQTRRKYEYLLDGVQEAHLVALACSQPPAGYRRWSLRLLASHMVRLEYVDDISHETIRQVMQANELKPWLKKEWCIPPKHSAEFVYYMEDVLDVYHRPYNLLYPIVCFDETPVQLVSETRQPIPARRNGQSLHVLRSAPELAARQSD
jgi:transposase